MNGVDTAARISAAKAKQLAEKGVDFVCRYLVPPEVYDKAVTATEAAALLEAGLGLLLCWETSADRVKAGAQAGARDGERARKCAETLGAPEDTVIYFAVDYNALAQDYDAIEYYFRSAAMACAPYGVGVYGSRTVAEMLAGRIPGIRIWQCWAWSNGMTELAHVYQYQSQYGTEAVALASEIGFAVDLDTCSDMAAAGVWLPSAPEPWYADDMRWAAEHGLIRDGRPNDPLTRAELARVLRRLCEGSEDPFDKERNRPSGLLSDE